MGIVLFGICIVAGIALGIIDIFFDNIIFFDSIFLAFISGVLCHSMWKIHPAFCLLIGIAVFLVLFLLQKTRVGFWIIGIVMSLLWAFVFGGVAYSIAGSDYTWGFVVMGLSFFIVGGLHIKARYNCV